MKLRLYLSATLIIQMCSYLHAHDGGHGPVAGSQANRTWTYADTGAHLHGMFESSRDGHVRIRTEEGRLVSIEIRKLAENDQNYIQSRLTEIEAINQNLQKPAGVPLMLASLRQPVTDDSANDRAKVLFDAFKPFEKSLGLRSDDQFFYVESNGMPDHPMMIGIVAWQQQVPLAQNYKGDNAWQIPLFPVPAKRPMSAKDNFFRGAIALAINGVPIFNPIKNDGVTDTKIAGELDEFGGHCGRGDDYHYHLPPVHLEKQAGKGKPVGYALDGYPIFGFNEPDGTPVRKLDWLNGHKDANGNYHYHSTKSYPYLNGGFYGEVVERDGQVDPQPRAVSPREALPPLRGAKITGFERSKDDKRISVIYDLNGDRRSVNYSLRDDNTILFQFDNGRDGVETATYSLNTPRRGPAGRDQQKKGGQRKDQQKKAGPNRKDQQRQGGPAGRDQQKKGDQRKDQQKKGGQRPPEEPSPDAGQYVKISPKHTGNFILTSPAIKNGAELPKEFNGDGEGATLPLSWKGAPEGTKSYALVMDHLAKGDEMKVYWILWDIPATTTSIPKNVKGVGKLGATWKRGESYVTPHSAGGGTKKYTLTVYALSDVPKLDPEKKEVTRDVLLTAIKDFILDSASLEVNYTKPE
ncbi:MAG: hypothetical protein RJA81_697 [Planctomycetota bacterium]|jgi:phosphatidylethanolamine-binding protein (PEBP) family uncharacterized protein